MLLTPLPRAFVASAAARRVAAPRVAPAAAAPSLSQRPHHQPRRGLMVSAASAWRDATSLADTLQRRHGVGRRAADVAAAANGGGGRRKSAGRGADAAGGEARARAPRQPRDPDARASDPARRGGKKNKHNNKGAQSAPTLEDAAALAADELSAFDDDDTGDYDPRALARELRRRRRRRLRPERSLRGRRGGRLPRLFLGIRGDAGGGRRG